jgi:hypothetical protein
MDRRDDADEELGVGKCCLGVVKIEADARDVLCFEAFDMRDPVPGYRSGRALLS